MFAKVAGDVALFFFPKLMGRAERRSPLQLKWINIQSKLSAQHFTCYVQRHNTFDEEPFITIRVNPQKSPNNAAYPPSIKYG